MQVRMCCLRKSRGLLLATPGLFSRPIGESNKGPDGVLEGHRSHTLFPLPLFFFSDWVSPPVAQSRLFDSSASSRKKASSSWTILWGYMVPLLSYKLKSGQLERLKRSGGFLMHGMSWFAGSRHRLSPEMNVAVIVRGMFWETIKHNYASIGTQAALCHTWGRRAFIYVKHHLCRRWHLDECSW